MAGKVVMLVALLVSNVIGLPENRLKRGYNTEHGGPFAYGVESDERGASIEDGGALCGIMDNSGSREHGYGSNGYPGHDYNDSPPHHNGGHTTVQATAAASASAYSN